MALQIISHQREQLYSRHPFPSLDLDPARKDKVAAGGVARNGCGEQSIGSGARVNAVTCGHCGPCILCRPKTSTHCGIPLEQPNLIPVKAQDARQRGFLGKVES